jgi:hypothetical protein
MMGHPAVSPEGARRFEDVLSPAHLAELRASGLDDDQVRRCGFRTRNDSEAIGHDLRWDGPATALGACLEIPYRLVTGELIPGYARFKPSCPRLDERGRPVKYEAPRHIGPRAYFPPRSCAGRLLDVTVPVLIPEGEKKAALLDQLGRAAAGIAGVWAWQRRRGTTEAAPEADEPRVLIEDLSILPWSGREVFLCFDTDVLTNPAVAWAEWHLAQALADRGATVRCVRLPARPAANGVPAKVGIDDYLVRVAHEGVDTAAAL